MVYRPEGGWWVKEGGMLLHCLVMGATDAISIRERHFGDGRVLKSPANIFMYPSQNSNFTHQTSKPCSLKPF